MKAPRIRFDLLVAICALGISSLAAGASYWQARVMETQTNVLEQQLGAQVWPYVTMSMDLDANTLHVSMENDGLGPAILRSATVTVDGASKSDFIAFLHAALGPNLIKRAPHGEHMNLAVSGLSPGSVVRSGQSIDLLTFGSKHYSRSLLRSFSRVNFRLCYCAVVPGRCWRNDTGSSRDPEPLERCPDVPGDLLHASASAALLTRDF